MAHKHHISKESYMALYPNAEWVSSDESRKISDRLRNTHQKQKEKNYDSYMETKRKVCEDMRAAKGTEWKHSDTTKEKMRLSHTGKARVPHSDATKHKLSIAKAGKKVKLTEQGRKEKKEKQKEAWAKRRKDHQQYTTYIKKLSERRREYLQRNGVSTPLKTNTSIERACATFLDEHNIVYHQQYLLDGKMYDFYIPDLNLLVEVDGEYWHTLSSSMKNDIEKHQIAYRHDKKLLRISTDNLDFDIIFETKERQELHTKQILEKRGLTWTYHT
jgi:very-short-patch-repair endonuclease